MRRGAAESRAAALLGVALLVWHGVRNSSTTGTVIEAGYPEPVEGSRVQGWVAPALAGQIQSAMNNHYEYGGRIVVEEKKSPVISFFSGGDHILSSRTDFVPPPVRRHS